MENKKYSLVLFDSPHHAFQFDNHAKKHLIEGRLVPVPRTLSSSCGMCYRIAYDKKEQLDILFELELPFSRFIVVYDGIV